MAKSRSSGAGMKAGGMDRPSSQAYSSSFSSGEQKAVDYAIHEIADKKRENLLVFDTKGNVVYREGGTKGHTGYHTEGVDYEGKTVIHNHPQGVYPFFSQTDFDTFHNQKIGMAAVVSKDYIVSVKKNPKATGQLKIDITNGRDFRNMGIRDEINRARRSLKQAKSQKEFDLLRDKYIQTNLQYQSDMAQESGYTLTWRKR